MNCAVITGRLTKDPELRTTPNNTPVCTFDVAVDRDYQKDGKKETDFITVVAWRQTAEFVARYFHKGKEIGVQGSVQTRNYEDKSGHKRKAVEIVADKVSFVGGKGTGETPKTPYNAPQSETGYVSVSENKSPLDDYSELPF